MSVTLGLAEEKATVHRDSTVTAEMSLELTDGTVFATTDGDQPATFTMGNQGAWHTRKFVIPARK